MLAAARVGSPNASPVPVPGKVRHRRRFVGGAHRGRIRYSGSGIHDCNCSTTQAVVSGESKVIINGATATLPFVANGQLRGIAVTGQARIASAPDLPTFTEAKLPSADVGSWQGLLTTAGSPRALVEKLNTALGEILKQPEVAERIAQQGGRVVAGPPADLGSWLATNTEAWGKVIADAGIKGE